MPITGSIICQYILALIVQVFLTTSTLHNNYRLQLQPNLAYQYLNSLYGDCFQYIRKQYNPNSIHIKANCVHQHHTSLLIYFQP